MKLETILEMMANPPSCPACHGTGPDHMGNLGSKIYMRCRDCGHIFHSVETEEEEK
jgi:tRNA(Ile2) C34 agmatinyltransferase TiaS